MDHPYIARRQFIKIHQCFDGKPGLIHEGERLDQKNVADFCRHDVLFGIRLPDGGLTPQLTAKPVHHHKPDVMAGALVLSAGIAQTNN